MKKLVISLGGSIIVPDKVDYKTLSAFKKVIEKNSHKYKFVIVCGGGSIARKYIEILKKDGKSQKEMCLAGIKATRMNAELMIKFFGNSNKMIPSTIIETLNLLEKNKVVITGAFRYSPQETSDTTSAKLARNLKTDFVNLTNVRGLYTSNPKKNKNAKFIPKISWNDFEKRASKIKYFPGQHFILDQKSAKIIKKHQIKTYILGNNMKNFDNFLKNKKFTGTIIDE